MHFVALSFFFYLPNFVGFDASMLKLQQMIKWDVLGGHGVHATIVPACFCSCSLFLVLVVCSCCCQINLSHLLFCSFSCPVVSA